MIGKDCVEKVEKFLKGITMIIPDGLDTHCYIFTGDKFSTLFIAQVKAEIEKCENVLYWNSRNK